MRVITDTVTRHTYSRACLVLSRGGCPSDRCAGNLPGPSYKPASHELCDRNAHVLNLIRIGVAVQLHDVEKFVKSSSQQAFCGNCEWHQTCARVTGKIRLTFTKQQATSVLYKPSIICSETIHKIQGERETAWLRCNLQGAMR